MRHPKARILLLLLGVIACANLAFPERPRTRLIRYSDIPPELRQSLSRQGAASNSFADFVRSMEQRTAERLRLGENDHLIAFLLQSKRFTAQPKIEPALSALEFVQSMTSEERGRYLNGAATNLPLEKIPKSVLLRIRDFIRALDQPAADERLSDFKVFLRESKVAPGSLPGHLASEYARSMKFLYQKEFPAKDASPEEKGARLASLYQDRGHSTDTQVEANFAVWVALSVLKSLTPSLQFERVLIVGPGLDFAPRTDLVDAYPPQSYQPFAVADALLGLQLSRPDRFRIHCVDINDRVVQYVKEFPKRKARPLIILSGLQGTADYNDYFQRLGRNIGAEGGLDALRALPGSYLKKSLLVRKRVAERISAARMNALTERYQPSPEYDLVVVTNVFLYFNASELLLALSNLHSMMKQGGYLIHNELRPEVESVGRVLGLTPIQGRTLQLSAGKDNPLVDGFVIQKKL